jgi:ribose transport system permease protein
METRSIVGRINPAIAAVAVIIIVLLATGFVLSDRFRTVSNLQNILEQSAPLAFVALGQTLVILAGGIDLSLDGQVALISTLASGLIDGQPDRVLPVVAGALLLGAAIGLANGALVLLLRVHPLIVTLGVAAILQGCTLLYTLTPVGSVPPDFDVFAYGRVLGVPIGIGLAVACFAAAGVVLHRTRLGRQVYAFGGDPHAAALVGVPVPRVILFCYGVSGVLAATTAIFLVSRLGVGSPVADQGFNLASITPVVVGGTLLTGGRGGVLGTLLGVVMVQLLNNLLNFLDVSTFYQWMIQGIIVIVAVSVHVERRRVAA